MKGGEGGKRMTISSLSLGPEDQVAIRHHPIHRDGYQRHILQGNVFPNAPLESESLWDKGDTRSEYFQETL